MVIMNDKIAYTDKMLASIFRRKECLVKQALETFRKYEMIEIIDNVITIPNWEKHQNVDGMDRIRELTKKRVQRHREKQKCNVTKNKDVTQCNVTVTQKVTQCNETEEDKEKEIEVEEKVVKEDVLIKKYQEEIGLATPATVVTLDSYKEELSEDMILKAIDIASERNRKSLSYVKGILNSWIRKGYKTLADTENENQGKNTVNKLSVEESIASKREHDLEMYKKIAEEMDRDGFY